MTRALVAIFLTGWMFCAPAWGQTGTLVNFQHLDHLIEYVQKDGDSLAFVHIYAEAPAYEWMRDEDEGVACVDDAARAAVLFLRHFELTGDSASRARAEALLRFVMYMQAESGLFYNFVWDRELRINTTHPNSVADEVSWWTARALWALGRCAEVLAGPSSSIAEQCTIAARRTLPHLDELLSRYPETITVNGRRYPTWLVYETASDATSELLLGLEALRRADPVSDLSLAIEQFAEGLRMMRYGDADTFPYGAHASWTETWHAWGNAQAQALAGTGYVHSARAEAETFYPRLLIRGFLHSMDLEDGTVRRFEQIAYGIRGVVVGLSRLFDVTEEARYATMAGIAASWLTGNNIADIAMYDPATGRGFDGISGPRAVNFNAGAESTIEALYTLLEVEARAQARKWLYVRGGPARQQVRAGRCILYRVFEPVDPTKHTSTSAATRVGVALDLQQGAVNILEGESLDNFLHP